MKKSWNVYNYFQKLICNRKIAAPMKMPPGPLGAPSYSTGHLYRAFISYIYKTSTIYAFISILMLVRRKSRKLFQRRRTEKKFENHCIMKINVLKRKTFVSIFV